ncbi:MAG: ABC transporter substrate-binding protein [Bifidobacteriaceae bacterium]|nr:ABC transporter substrate-binding protein [Bifidobacteriaceae bacterium]
MKDPASLIIDHPHADRCSRRPRRGLRALVRACAVTAIAAVAATSLASCVDTTTAANPTNSATGGVPEVIRIAAETAPASLDTNTWQPFGAQIGYLYGGTLALPGWADQGDRMELAESVSESADRLTWTIKLKPDLKFSDGSSLTAPDVVASFERLRAGPMTWTVKFLQDTEGIKAVDDSTVEVKLSRPHTDFAKQIAEPYALIFPAAGLAEGDSFFEHPISAGRYSIETMDVANGRFELTANPNYYAGEQQVKRIVITKVPEAATRLAQLKNGEIDFMDNIPGSLASQLTDGMRLDPAWWPGSFHGYLYNFNDPVIKDANVRRAIDLAVDREQMAELVLGGADFARPLYGIPWTVTGEPPNVQPFARDLDEAKRLLRGTVCEDGCSVKLISWSDNTWQRNASATALQEQLKAIGIEVEIVPVTSANGDEVMARGDFGLTLAIAQYFVDSPNYIGQVMLDPSSLYGESYSPGFSQSAEAATLTELMNQFRGAREAELPELMATADQFLADNSLILPMAMLSTTAATSLPETVITNIFGLYYVIP